MIAILVLALIQMAGAAEIASPGQDLDSFFYTPKTPSANTVQRELECIQFRTPNNQEMIKRPQASAMIRHLAPSMEDGFKRFGVNSFERALFYAQAIEESGGFTQLSESVEYSRRGVDPIGHIIVNNQNDRHFSAKKDARRSREFGVYRGRGFVQISRCDNYLSVVHYLNQVYAGKKPVWNAFWTIPDGKKSKQISTVCSKAELSAFKKQYFTEEKMNPNLYGVLDDPMRFAMIGSELTDPVTKKKIASERFMIDASLAYWRGRCGAVIEGAADMKRIGQTKACASFSSESYVEHAVKCVTQCIKGSTEGWQRRAQWMRDALLCMR